MARRGGNIALEVTGIEARGHVLDPRVQAAVWRFGPNMIGHTIEFTVIFEYTDEDSRSRVEARLETPQKDGSKGEVVSSAMIATGRVNFSFVFEAPGDLLVTLSYRGEKFFEDAIPLQL